MKSSFGCQGSQLDSRLVVSWNFKPLSPSQVSIFSQTCGIYFKNNH